MNIDKLNDTDNEFDELYVGTLKNKIAEKHNNDDEVDDADSTDTLDDDSDDDVDGTDDTDTDDKEDDSKDIKDDVDTEDKDSKDDIDTDTDDKEDDSKDIKDDVDTEDDDSKDDVTEDKVAAEHLRSIYADNVAIEDLSSSIILTTLISVGLGALLKGALTLSKTILTYIVKIIKLTYKSLKFTETYHAIKVAKSESLGEDIDTLIKTAELLEDDTVPTGTYKAPKIIQRLLIGDSVDFKSNLDVHAKSYQIVSSAIPNSIVNNVKDIKNLIAIFSTNPSKSIVNILKDNLNFGSLLSKGNLGFTDSQSEYVEPWHLPGLLMGNKVLVVNIPDNKIVSVETVASAINHSDTNLLIDTDRFSDMIEVGYLNKEQLLDLLQSLKGLNDVLLDSTKNYKKVIATKSNVLGFIKLYVKAVFSTKPRFKDSIVYIIYLKLLFIDKILLATMIDTTDHTVTSISATMQYVKANIKAL